MRETREKDRTQLVCVTVLMVSPTEGSREKQKQNLMFEDMRKKSTGIRSSPVLRWFDGMDNVW